MLFISLKSRAPGAVCAFLVCCVASSGPSAAADNVFAGFAGAWSGDGTMILANGDTRRLACSSTYVVGAAGTTLSQALDCTSDGGRLQLSASYTYASGGAVSGNWREASRGASGNLSGKATAGRIDATVAGVGFVAGLGMNARAGRQSLTLQAQGGGEFRRVSINLHKV